MTRFVRFLTPFAFLLAIAASAFPAASVSAASTAAPHHAIHLMPTHQLGTHSNATKPAVSGSGDLTYNGGPVQHSPRTYVVFWGSSWKNSGGALNSVGNVVDKYFRDVGSTSFENILTQYYDGGGRVQNSQAYGGYWIDSATPGYDYSCGGRTVQDSAIQNEVNHAIASKGWPRDSANAIYYVYTPSGYYVNDGSGSCSEQQFCAYHGYSTSSLAYAAMAYPLSLSGCGVPSYPNGSAQGDSLVSVTSHEQAEAITDPQLNAWYDAAGYEIGDKCAWDFSRGYTHLNNGGTFEIQTEYSNASHSCVNSY